MTHLGERVSDLVDAQLSAEATDRAHAHLAQCGDCRDRVEEERLLKARLQTLAGPAPSADFTARLLALGGPAGPLPPRVEHVPGMPRPKPVPVAAAAARPPQAAGSRRPGRSAGTPGPAGRPAALRAGARRGLSRRRIAVAMMSALGVMGVGAVGLSAAAGTVGTGPVPVVDSLLVQRVLTSSLLPVVDVPAGWNVVRQAGQVATGSGGAQGR